MKKPHKKMFCHFSALNLITFTTLVLKSSLINFFFNTLQMMPIPKKPRKSVIFQQLLLILMVAFMIIFKRWMKKLPLFQFCIVAT